MKVSKVIDKFKNVGKGFSQAFGETLDTAEETKLSSTEPAEPGLIEGRRLEEQKKGKETSDEFEDQLVNIW